MSIWNTTKLYVSYSSLLRDSKATLYKKNNPKAIAITRADIGVKGVRISPTPLLRTVEVDVAVLLVVAVALIVVVTTLPPGRVNVLT